MTSDPTSPTPPRHTAGQRMVSLLLNIVLPVALLVAAVGGAKYMLDTRPTTARRPAQRNATLVAVTTATAQSQAVLLEGMGTVTPARQVPLKPELGGRIVWLADGLQPGGQFKAGQPMARIEPRDYQLALAQRRSELHQAQAAVIEAERSLTAAQVNLKIEMGNQAVAQREYDLLGEKITHENADLVLRRPQLAEAAAQVKAAEAAVASATASVEAAQARVDDAQLDLNRTTIAAPFDLIVQSKLTELGDTVSSTTPIADVLGTEQFWVEVSLPQSDLPWVDSADAATGSPVKLYNAAAWRNGQFREGRVIRKMASVDHAGRMAQVLVAVDDPLALADDAKPPLLAGSYVRAVIAGRTMASVLALPRELVRDGSTVWVMTDDGRLDIRPIDVVYRGRQVVFIASGLEAGEQVVTTDLPAPVPGMSLRTSDESAPAEGATE